MDKIKILVVDNEEKVIKQLARFMESDSRLALIGTARNGYEAVASVAKNPPDVIVMDIEMESKLAGLYAAQEIIKISHESKVIIHTENADSYYIFKAFQFGVSDYLLKGASEHEMIDTIIRAHEGRSIIHPEAAAQLRREFISLKNAQENLAYTMNVVIKLTQSELDILKLLKSGMKQQEIAKIRFIEMSTMKTHISNILKKFDRRSVVELLETLEQTGFFMLLNDSE